MFEDHKKENYNNLRNREDLTNPDLTRSRESLFKRKVELDRQSNISEHIDRIESKTNHIC